MTVGMMSWLTGEWSALHRVSDRATGAWFHACETGLGPDADISIGVDKVESNATGISYRRTVRGPAWKAYVSEAQRFIAAARALGLME